MSNWIVFAAGGTVETALLPHRLLYFRADYGVAIAACVSPGALDFVTKTALTAVTGDCVYDPDARFAPASSRPMHIEFSEADLVVVYPATARILAQCALGDITCPVTRLVAFTPKDRVMFAPAIHPRMDVRLYAPHVDRLRSVGCTVLGDSALHCTWAEIEAHIVTRLSLTKTGRGDLVLADLVSRETSVARR